jgi:hypothetical protein
MEVEIHCSEISRCPKIGFSCRDGYLEASIWSTWERTRKAWSLKTWWKEKNSPGAMREAVSKTSLMSAPERAREEPEELEVEMQVSA